MSEIKHTLSKKERLSYEKRIEALFSAGKNESFIAYPLRVVYLLREKNMDDSLISILVSVSKKRFKRAVKRNRVKRLVREAYRLNKSEFIEIFMNSGKSVDIAFLFLKNELPDYGEIEKAILKTSKILKEKMLEVKSDANIS